MNQFKTFWNGFASFEKGEALTKTEQAEVRAIIKQLQKAGLSSSKIIKRLQRDVPKLSEEYKASRAYWTTTKELDTHLIAEAGEDLGIDKYRVILSPNACTLCREKTQNGAKVFKQADLEKTGYGQFVPWHPNCYCVAVPTI